MKNVKLCSAHVKKTLVSGLKLQNAHVKNPNFRSKITQCSCKKTLLLGLQLNNAHEKKTLILGLKLHNAPVKNRNFNSRIM